MEKVKKFLCCAKYCPENDKLKGGNQIETSRILLPKCNTTSAEVPLLPDEKSVEEDSDLDDVFDDIPIQT